MSRTDALRRWRADDMSPWRRCRAGGVLSRLAYTCGPWMSRQPPHWPTSARIAFAAELVSSQSCEVNFGFPHETVRYYDFGQMAWPPSGGIVAAASIGPHAANYRIVGDPLYSSLSMSISVCLDFGVTPAAAGSPCRGRMIGEVIGSCPRYTATPQYVNGQWICAEPMVQTTSASVRCSFSSQVTVLCDQGSIGAVGIIGYVSPGTATPARATWAYSASVSIEA